jgi:hypothetical protein
MKRILKNHTNPCIHFLFGKICIFMVIFLGFTPLLVAQTEDTTRVERDGPEELETLIREHPSTPYHINIPEFNIHHYRLDDYEGTHTFFRRLRYLTPGEILMTEEEWYDRYGAQWEREINEQLAAILQATFKEKNSLLTMIQRIAPFLGFGFFERYELPIVPRIDDADRVYVED